jgi:hypothetical protein
VRYHQLLFNLAYAEGSEHFISNLFLKLEDSGKSYPYRIRYLTIMAMKKPSKCDLPDATHLMFLLINTAMKEVYYSN